MKTYKKGIRQAGGLIIVLSALLAGVYGQSIQENQSFREKVKAVRKARFGSIYEMLRNYGVPFDPEILLEANWKERLAPILAQMPEMQMVKYRTEPLRGVVLADTLYLPERVDLIGDTIILANSVVFEGKEGVIKGRHKLVFYPMMSAGVLEGPLPDHLRSDSIPKQQLAIGTMPEIKGGKITISLSGNGYNEWLQKIGGEERLRRVINDLYSRDEEVRKKAQREYDEIRRPRQASPNGTSQVRIPSDKDPVPGDDAEGIGERGADGDRPALADPSVRPQAANGVCTSDPGTRHGAEGEKGATGGSAGTGRIGGIGPTGGDAEYGDIRIPDGSATHYNLDAHGGAGGEGGAGGLAFDGEQGGIGGKGGDGANCECIEGGAGNGGRGGEGGNGGSGGRGGRGGPGGPGGNGADIILSKPGRPCWTGSVSTNVNMGKPGKGGQGAAGTRAGSAGLPGGGGGIPQLVRCGTSISLGQGTPGYPGDPGDPGSLGSEGDNGEVKNGELMVEERECPCKKP